MVPIEDITCTEQFSRLTEQQQKLVVCLHESEGDWPSSVKEAFNPGSAASLRAMVHKLQNNEQITQLTDLFLDEKPLTKEKFIAQLQKNIKVCQSDAARASLMRLYTELMGWTKRQQPGPVPKHEDFLDRIEGL